MTITNNRNVESFIYCNPLGSLPTLTVEIIVFAFKSAIDTESVFSLVTTAISVIGFIAMPLCLESGVMF